MSAPQTEPEKQARNHMVPIVGMLVIVVVVILGFFWWYGDETHDPEMPGQAPGQTDGAASSPDALPGGDQPAQRTTP